MKRNATKENAPNAPRYISDEYFYARIITLKLRCMFGTRMVKRVMVLARFCLCTKTLERFCERKDLSFFPKRCTQNKNTQKHATTKGKRGRSFPRTLYTSSVCFVRRVDSLRILFYGVCYVNPREQKKTRVQTCKQKVLILIY